MLDLEPSQPISMASDKYASNVKAKKAVSFLLCPNGFKPK